MTLKKGDIFKSTEEAKEAIHQATGMPKEEIKEEKMAGIGKLYVKEPWSEATLAFIGEEGIRITLAENEIIKIAKRITERRARLESIVHKFADATLGKVSSQKLK